MEKEKPSLREKTGIFRKFIFRTSASMLASGFFTFAVVFIIAGSLDLIIQLFPWLFRSGVTDIDPLSILARSLLLALLATGLRYLIMRRFSHIYLHRKVKKDTKKKEKKPEPAPEKKEEQQKPA